MIYTDRIHTKSLFKTGKTESIQTAPDHMVHTIYNVIHPDESILLPVDRITLKLRLKCDRSKQLLT